MSNDINENTAERLKDFILEVESKASKELIASRGYTEVTLLCCGHIIFPLKVYHYFVSHIPTTTVGMKNPLRVKKPIFYDAHLKNNINSPQKLPSSALS